MKMVILAHISEGVSSTCTWIGFHTTHSVNVHANSVLPILYIGMFRTCQQMSADGAESVWAGLTFKSCGLSATFQVHWPMGLHISIWAGTPASSGLAGAYLYLDVCIEWTKIVIVAHISNWDCSTFT
jgi:hypothetical protein